MSACLPGSSEPISVVPAEHPGAADGGQLQRVAHGQRLRAAAGPGEQQRVPGLLEQRAGLVAGRAVDAEPDRHAGGPQVAVRAMPAPSRALDVGQCATPVPVAASFSMAASSKWMPCASQTSSPSQPSDSM